MVSPFPFQFLESHNRHKDRKIVLLIIGSIIFEMITLKGCTLTEDREI